jgi:lysozyme family protein
MTTRLAENTQKWERMKIKPSFWPAAQKFAQRALVHKDRYISVAARIKREYDLYIPWWFIPLVHERECIRGVDNFGCNIAQGEPFTIKSRIIPHSGPFTSWEDAAVDALVKQAPQAARWTNWSGGGALTIAESYNGLGYYRMGVTNPYLFSGTDQYIKGKYVSDGKYKANVVDTQLGVAISLRALMEADPSIQLDGKMPGQDKVHQKTETGTVMTLQASVLAFINTNPWFIFTWTDILGIAAAGIVVTGIVLYFIKKWKRHHDL